MSSLSCVPRRDVGRAGTNLVGFRSEREKSDSKMQGISKGNPAARDYAQKEAFPGSGTAENAQEYIAESHSCPSCFVVAGYGVKGTNDKESPMPAIHKPPISLILPELAAVDTWLYVREGREAPVSKKLSSPMKNSFRKRIVQSSQERRKPVRPVRLMADGTEPVDQIFAKAQCVACHTIPGIPGATVRSVRSLLRGTNAPLRMKDKDYKGTAKIVPTTSWNPCCRPAPTS